MPVIIVIWEAEIRRIIVRSHPRQIVCESLSQKKYPTQNGVSGVAQVVKHLSSKHEALSLNPNTTKKEKIPTLGVRGVVWG
jgi:hypothetical protein